MSFGGYPFFPGMGNQGYYDYCQGQGYDPGYGYGYNNMPEGAIRPRDPNEPYDVHSEWIGDMPLAEWQDQQDHYYQRGDSDPNTAWYRNDWYLPEYERRHSDAWIVTRANDYIPGQSLFQRDGTYGYRRGFNTYPRSGVRGARQRRLNSWRDARPSMNVWPPGATFDLPMRDVADHGSGL